MLADRQRTSDPQSDRPSSQQSGAGQGKFAGQRPAFYHCATPPTKDARRNPDVQAYRTCMRHLSQSLFAVYIVPTPQIDVTSCSENPQKIISRNLINASALSPDPITRLRSYSAGGLPSSDNPTNPLPPRILGPPLRTYSILFACCRLSLALQLSQLTRDVTVMSSHSSLLQCMSIR